MESKERREERQKVVLNDIEVAPHASKTSKIVNRLVVGGLLIATLGLALMLKWSLQSDVVLKVNNDPIPTRTIRQNPTPDGVVILTLDYCKLQNVTGTLRMSYVSETREIFLPLNDEKIPKGCKTSEFPILIPKNIPPDTYRIKFHTVYNLNPLKQNITQDFESAPFTVVAPGGPGSEKVVSQ